MHVRDPHFGHLDFELRLHRSVDAQVRVVACQPADQLRIEHVGGDDEDQHAAVLQQRQRTLIEQLFTFSTTECEALEIGSTA